MKKIKLLILCFSLLLFSACGNLNEKEQASLYSAIDDKGNEVTFNVKPSKIYCNTQSLEEILLELSGPENMVAVSQDSADSEIEQANISANKVQNIVPDRLGPEQILALQPDLVIVQERDELFVKTLEELGLKVFVLVRGDSLERVKDRIVKISKAIGEEEKGQKMLAEVESKVAKVESVLANIPLEKRVTGIAYSQMGAFGSKQGLFNDICTHAGVINGAALAGLEYGDHLTKEKIVEVNPDLFIFPKRSTQVGNNSDYNFVDEVMGDPAFQSIKAVKNNKYIVVLDRYRYCSSQYIADAITEIAKAAYPDYF